MDCRNSIESFLSLRSNYDCIGRDIDAFALSRGVGWEALTRASASCLALPKSAFVILEAGFVDALERSSVL